MSECVVVSQLGPELLPRVSMLLLLTRVISTAAPRLQVHRLHAYSVSIRLCLLREMLTNKNGQIVSPMRGLTSVLVCFVFQVLAAQCLTAVCGSAGGGKGCALAEQAEIDVLLEALLSPCFSVRDAALRVSTKPAMYNGPCARAFVHVCVLIYHLTICPGPVGDGAGPAYRKF